DSVGTGAANLTWVGGLGPVWDLNQTSNWKTNGATSTYFDGDTVNFRGDASSTNVQLNTTVLPGSIVFDSPFDYTISGNGTIGGVGGIIKNNTNTATINTQNTFTGGITINGGSIVLTQPTSGGTGTITLNSGTLRPQTATGLGTVANPLVIPA